MEQLQTMALPVEQTTPTLRELNGILYRVGVPPHLHGDHCANSAVREGKVLVAIAAKFYALFLFFHTSARMRRADRLLYLYAAKNLRPEIFL